MKPLKALIVEDSETDEELLLRQLAKADYDVQSIRVQTAADMEKALGELEWDIILSDYTMPGFTGLDALRVLKESGLDIPLIIISGTIGEDTAVEAMRVGVDDYLMKGNLTRIAPAIERELENAVSHQAQKRVEEALRRSEENLANAQRIAHIGSWETDLVNNRLFWSDEVYRIFGVSKDDFGATLESFFNFIHPEDRLLVQAVADAAMSGNAPFNIEHRIVRPNGEERTVCAIGEVTFDESGNPVRLIGTVQDITKRIVAEAEMRLMKSAVDSIAEGIVITDAQKPDNPIIYTNAAFENVKGYTLEEVKGQNCRFLQGAETNLRTVKEIREAIKQETSFRGEILNYRKNGESFWNDLSISPVFDQSGLLTNFVGVQQDISERRQAEKDLHESEERFRSIVETTSEWIWAFDSQGNCSYSNPALETILGYAPEEIIGKSFLPIMHEEEREKIRQLMPTLIADKRGWTNLVLRWYHKDGSIRYLKSNALPLLDSGGKVIGYRGSDRDITESRRIEEEKRLLTAQIERQHERLNNIIDNITGVVWEAWGKPDEATQKIDFISDYVEVMLGYTVEEWLATPNFWLSIVHPDDWERMVQVTAENFSKSQSFIEEFRWLTKDGRTVWVETHSTVINDKAGQAIGYRGINIDITERKRAENALRQAEDKYRTLVESSPAIVYLSEPHPPFAPIYVSPNVTRFGYPVEEWFDRPDMWVSLIHDEDRARVLRATENAVAQGEETDMEYRVVAKDGAIVWLHDKGRFVLDDQGNKTGWQGVMVDITKTKELEDQLRQSQKLESVGLLAGGIAHDFNNMLTAINGYSSLTLRKLAADDPLRQNIEEIKKAGERSADLTHQLLAFSRQQLLKPIILDLNGAIVDTSKMLQRVLGEDIQLTTTLNPRVGRIKADPGQLSQIIMNLAVNARDAMLQGGNLTIETDNVFLEPDYARRHAGVLPGAYVMLAVSDSGAGMSDKTKEHIFEPFFTTKAVGQGTGLGLATVYGIVKQSGGSIEVYSEEGIGTTFKVYLPRVAQDVIPEKIKGLSAQLHKGTETIMLVEDEDLVRHLSRQILEESGYTVIEARNGSHALEICEQEDCKFDLLMTDVVMPQMGGRELAEKLRSRLPDIKILFTSGYTDDAVVRHGVIEADTNFIQKPFSPDTLAEKIKEILGNI